MAKGQTSDPGVGLRERLVELVGTQVPNIDPAMTPGDCKRIATIRYCPGGGIAQNRADRAEILMVPGIPAVQAEIAVKRDEPCAIRRKPYRPVAAGKCLRLHRL